MVGRTARRCVSMTSTPTFCKYFEDAEWPYAKVFFEFEEDDLRKQLGRRRDDCDCFSEPFRTRGAGPVVGAQENKNVDWRPRIE